MIFCVLHKYCYGFAIAAIIGGVAACGGGDDTPKDLAGTISFTIVRNGNTIGLDKISVFTGTEITAYYSGYEDVTFTYQWKIDETDVGTNSIKYTPETAGSCTLTLSAQGYNPKTSEAFTVKGDPTWKAIEDNKFGTGKIECIDYLSSASGFLVGGEDGIIVRSFDGETWATVTDSTFGTGDHIYKLSRMTSGGKFIAVGTGSGDYGKTATATTGNVRTTWDSATPILGSNAIYAFAAKTDSNDNKINVAGGSGGKIAYSTDSETWTETDSKFGSDYINSIAYGNNKFVAVGAKGKIAYSSDGQTWTAVADSTFGTSTTIFSVAYGNNLFVAVGADGKMAVSSDGGETWTAVTDSTFGSDYIRSIAFGNIRASGSFVAVGDNGKAAYSSSDGATWTAFADSTFTGNINAVAYDNYRFVAGGDNGKMAILSTY